MAIGKFTSDNAQHELCGSAALCEIVASKGTKSQNKEKYKLIEIDIRF
jgi:hypothetical protein